MRIAAFVAGALVLTAGPALAVKPTGVGLIDGAAVVEAAEPAPAFSEREVRIIREHFEADAHDGHAGKAKKKRLPPGIAKNLARGKPLPPGIAKQTLPYDLERRLPPVREGHERIIVDGKVILVETATRIIRDILYDVLD